VAEDRNLAQREALRNMPAMLKAYRDDLICRLASGLDPHDRQLFIADAEQALAAMPPESIGPGTAYRVVECVWRGYFKPADTGHEPQTALRTKRSKNDPRLKVITFEGVEYPGRVKLAQHLAPRLGRNLSTIAMALRKLGDDASAVLLFYASGRERARRV
jgi:hypothetical protein